MMNAQVDHYLLEGCGRCDLYGTPECKVHRWRDILIFIRPIILDSGLVEEFKWKQPCYTWNGKNVLIMTAFKDHAALAFFKGTLLSDLGGALIAPGPNSHSTRQMRFTSIDEAKSAEPIIRDFIAQAIQVEEEGRKITPRPISEMKTPEELETEFLKDPAFRTAFYALTPGRQKGYLLYFDSAKQSSTRSARIEKFKEKIFQGLGMNDR